MKPLRVTGHSIACATGIGQHALAAALRNSASGLRPNDFSEYPLATWIGRVPGIEDVRLPDHLLEWDCRNNRLAWLALNADGFLERAVSMRSSYGADRVALVVGTSTSSIGATEEAYRRLLPDGQYPEDLRRPIVHTPHSLGDFVRAALGLEGIVVTVGTACSSSAKVFAQAERLMSLGLVDAAVVGGVDSLCGSVLFGFNSLELVSPEPCRPFDVSRRGISIGEAGGFALLERSGERGPWLLGYGESSDAYHMSSPHPEGLGARLAMESALQRAGLTPDVVDYINMHGTASQKNDEVEARVVAKPVSSHDTGQFDQGVDGARSRGSWHSRVRNHVRRDGDGHRARYAQHPGTRSFLRSADSCAERARGHPGRAQQFIWFRRQQLLAALRQGPGCVSQPQPRTLHS